MKRVVVVSPLRGDRERNKRYARLCMQDCLRRGEAPIAAHVLYDHPDVLDDEVLEDRQLGMQAGLAWGRIADLYAVYVDLSDPLNVDESCWSDGMRTDAAYARVVGIPVEPRRLPDFEARMRREWLRARGY